MFKKNRVLPFKLKELIFQVILHLLVLTFYAYDRNSPHIDTYRVLSFFVYALAALFINYSLLPRFFYNKKYVHFTFLVVLVFLILLLAEEFILEQIFYRDMKGESFSEPFYSFIEIFPIIAILTGSKFGWDALHKQREVDELKTNLEQSELLFLKSQINPHFLFNNLNNLYSYALEKSPKTPSIILELSSVLRYMLYDCKEQYVPLTKEIEQMEHFTKLNQMQTEDRGTVSFHVENIRSDYLIAPLILVVFIENAFKHSQSDQIKNIQIKINIHLTEGGVLKFRCENNMRDQDSKRTGAHGIGLMNVKKRLDLLYPGSYELRINQGNDSFVVDLSLSLSKAQPV
jgi:hypothetical protein